MIDETKRRGALCVTCGWKRAVGDGFYMFAAAGHTFATSPNGEEPFHEVSFPEVSEDTPLIEPEVMRDGKAWVAGVVQGRKAMKEEFIKVIEGFRT